MIVSISLPTSVAVQLAIGIKLDGILGEKAGVEGVLRQRKTGAD
jgi:hypothetical protein